MESLPVTTEVLGVVERLHKMLGRPRAEIVGVAVFLLVGEIIADNEDDEWRNYTRLAARLHTMR